MLMTRDKKMTGKPKRSRRRRKVRNTLTSLLAKRRSEKSQYKARFLTTCLALDQKDEPVI